MYICMCTYTHTYTCSDICHFYIQVYSSYFHKFVFITTFTVPYCQSNWPNFGLGFIFLVAWLVFVFFFFCLWMFLLVALFGRSVLVCVLFFVFLVCWVFFQGQGISKFGCWLALVCFTTKSNEADSAFVSLLVETQNMLQINIAYIPELLAAQFYYLFSYTSVLKILHLK